MIALMRRRFSIRSIGLCFRNSSVSVGNLIHTKKALRTGPYLLYAAKGVALSALSTAIGGKASCLRRINDHQY